MSGESPKVCQKCGDELVGELTGKYYYCLKCGVYHCPKCLLMMRPVSMFEYECPHGNKINVGVGKGGSG